jgi:hypothetical protein
MIAATLSLAACTRHTTQFDAPTTKRLDEARRLVSAEHRDVPAWELSGVPLTGPGTIMRARYCPNEVLVVLFPRANAPRMRVREWRVDVVKKLVGHTIEYDMTKRAPDVFERCLDGTKPIPG